MTDREKVIKAIEICYSGKHSCTECELFYVEDCNDKLMRDVLELLKEQEPVNPQKMLDGSWSYERCGACGNVLYERGFAYCPWCGRKVKWDG